VQGGERKRERTSERERERALSEDTTNSASAY
jgi:hypothetical protein